MTITLRNTKGSELTFAELDGNFTDLDGRVQDSNEVRLLIDSAYVLARADSAYVTGIIDSAYVTGIIDSAYTTSIIDSSYVTDIIDSAYVQAREGTPTITISRFDYTADSGQTVFTDSDDNGNVLSFDSATTQVYLNGLLLNPALDYTLTLGDTVTTTTGIDSDHLITITSLSVS